MKKKKIILSIILGTFLTGGIGAGLLINNSTKTNTTDNVQETIENSGIKIKLLNSVTNEDSSIVKTFSYEVLPANATNKTVTLEVNYIDKTSCTDIVKAEIDQESNLITLTCLGPFEKKIIVTVTSVDNPNAKAEITLNYLKKLLALNAKISEINVGEDWTSNIKTKVDYSDYYNPIYSKYTKDSSFTYGIKDVEVSCDEILYQIPTSLQDTVYLMIDKIQESIADSFNKESRFLNKEEIWNLIDSNKYHSWLYDASKVDTKTTGAYICYEVMATIYNKENPAIETRLGGNSHFYLYLSLQTDYSAKKIKVDSISTGNNEVDF